MFLIPIGIWNNTPGLSVSLYIWKGIIPAGLGNIVGGGLFCAGVLWYLHIEGEGEIAVDGVYYEPHGGASATGANGHGNGHGLRFRFGSGKKDEEVGEVSNVSRWDHGRAPENAGQPQTAGG
jgi:hypothetical protein